MSGWLRFNFDELPEGDQKLLRTVYAWMENMRQNEAFAEDDRLAASDVIRGLAFLRKPVQTEVVKVSKQPYERLRGRDTWAPEQYAPPDEASKGGSDV